MTIQEKVARWLFDMDYDGRKEFEDFEAEYLTRAGYWLAQDIVLAVQSDSFREGYEAAMGVFEDKFFGGPTKQMVMGWFEEKYPTSVSAGTEER